MTEISVTIISLNEADNIAACLESVGWADEIVLVDGFSSDGTARLAEGMGARVFLESWKGYSAQKNSAIEKAGGRWILTLDADERVPDLLRKEIESVLKMEDPCSGYFIPRRNFFCGREIRHGGWRPDHNLRLFLKSAGRFEERAVHEKVVVNGRTGYLKHPMDHYTYDSVDDYLERLKRYSTLAAKELAHAGKKAGRRHLILRPPFTFLKMYLLQLGFLDGRAGFFLAVSYAYYTFLKYVKLREPHWNGGSAGYEQD